MAKKYLIHTVRICYPVNVGGFEVYAEPLDEENILETESDNLLKAITHLDLGAIKVTSVLIERKPGWYES